jgi:CBS domain-containing protein
MRVEDLMRRDVVVARPQTSLHEVARLLASHGISGMPVVDGSGRVVGVVSELDVLARANRGRRRPRLLSLLAAGARERLRTKLTAGTAAEAMSRPAVTARACDTIAAAASTMTSQRVNRLPVVDAEGRLVGIVARSDVVRAFARPDAEVEEEIRELLARGLSIPRHAVDVHVTAGDVTLTGRVETAAVEELLVALVGQVPGVLSVTPALAHERDDAEPRWPSPRLFAGVG